MNIDIKIDTSNAAFDGVLSGLQTAMILRCLADKVEGGPVHKAVIPLYDSSGNKVGYYKADKAEEEE